MSKWREHFHAPSAPVLVSLSHRTADHRNERSWWTLQVLGGEFLYNEPKTRRGRRLIALDAATVAAFRSHRRRQAEERLAAGPAYAETGLVLTNGLGEPLHPDMVSTAFRRHVKTTGLPRIGLHGLRHTHATLALLAGIHPKVVSERLGHSSVAFTLDVYSHAIPALHEEAAEQAAALIAGP